MYGANTTFWSESKEGTSDLIRRQKAWENIPEDLDILITHMPPKYILDTNPSGEHCGCSQLAEKVKLVKPKYHVFGHIHLHGGKTQEIWETEFINCAVKNEQYLTVRGAQEINIDV
jgi:Icc-related predicted phosphoesterase